MVKSHLNLSWTLSMKPNHFIFEEFAMFCLLYVVLQLQPPTIMGMNTHHPISTLGPRQDQAGVRHVITQVNMRAPAQYPPPFLERDVCFYGNSVGTNYWAVSSSLTLDFATFRIPANRTEE